MSQYHNKLRNLLKKNDMETPENKLIVDVLEHKYPEHGKLAEWLHREIRKERIHCRALEELPRVVAWLKEEKTYLKRAKEQEAIDGEGNDGGWRGEAKYCKKQAKQLSAAIENPEYLRDSAVMVGNQPIEPETLTSIATVLQKKKQRGEKANIMKFEIEDLLEEARSILFEEKARDAGEVLYEFADGWTIRRICTGAEMKLEGEMLGHCAGQYAEKVDRGESHNYSLRDDRGFAHLTLEIKHTRPGGVNMQALLEAIDYIDMDYECPYCAIHKELNSPVVNGRCTACFFNIEDLEAYERTQQGEGRLEAIQRQMDTKYKKLYKEICNNSPERDNFKLPCPHCGRGKYIRERPHIPGTAPNAECEWCGAIFWGKGDPYTPKHPHLVGGRNSGAPSFVPHDWRKALNTSLNIYMEHDFRDGQAYQIQGKQNVSPHAKYHPYVQEWLRSIPYEERPLASWSAYYTKTSVLHIDDLELGGAKGEDDFGFKWENRPYDWRSILFSLHGEPKRWAKDNTEHVKRFREEDSAVANTLTYKPELGERMFEFAKENSFIEEIKAIFDEWKEMARVQRGGFVLDPLKALPCNSCARVGYLRPMAGYKGKVHCGYCGDSSLEKQYTKDIETQLETIDIETQYNTYEKAVIDHLGGLIEADGEIVFKLDSYTSLKGYAKKKNKKQKKFSDPKGKKGDRWVPKEYLWNQKIEFQPAVNQNQIRDIIGNFDAIFDPPRNGQ